MLKFSKSLTSLLALLLAQNVLADDTGIETSLTGFVTGTAFSDKDWHTAAYTAALNFDVTKGFWAVRGQIAEPYAQPIRRLVAERSIFVAQGNEVLVQVGRFPRIDSFYNNVTDTPASAEMAILPLAVYNRRIVKNRTFNSLDGAQIIYTIQTLGIVRLHADYGKMTVENQCETQIEASKLPCRTGYRIDGIRGNYDYGVTYEINNFTLLAYRGDIRAKTVLLNPKDITSVVLSTKASSIDYDTVKFGARYDYHHKWWVQTEMMHNDFSLALPGKPFVSGQRSVNRYVLVGACATDQFCSYASYNHGKNTTGGKARDLVVGSTYTYNTLTTSLEYHRGSGRSWEKYFAPAADWSSWVLSITKGF